MKFMCPVYIVICPQAVNLTSSQKKTNWSIRENKQIMFAIIPSSGRCQWREAERIQIPSTHGGDVGGELAGGCVRVPASASAFFLFPPDLLPPPLVLTPPPPPSMSSFHSP